MKGTIVPLKMKKAAVKAVQEGKDPVQIARKLNVKKRAVLYWCRGMFMNGQESKGRKKLNLMIKEGGTHRDAIIYLRQARQVVVEGLRTGKFKTLGREHLLLLLALEALGGD